MLLTFVFAILLTVIQTPNSDNSNDGVEVSERYTLRVKKPGRSGTPKVRAMVISPDGKQVAVSTSNELLFVRTADGEITSRFDYSPFSMTYSNDSQQLFSISERQSKMFQVAPPAEIGSSFTRPKGYLGVQLKEKNGKLVITSVVPTSSASKQTSLVGAELVGIGEGSGTNVESVVGMTLKRLLPKLDGPANTKVTFSIIPKGKIDESKVTLTRMVIESSGSYAPFTPSKSIESVASCLVDGFHEFRSSRTGNYVSSIRCEQINNDRGTEATSKTGDWFVFIGQYKDKETATIEVGKTVKTEPSDDQPRW